MFKKYGVMGVTFPEEKLTTKVRTKQARELVLDAGTGWRRPPGLRGSDGGESPDGHRFRQAYGAGLEALPRGVFPLNQNTAIP